MFLQGKTGQGKTATAQHVLEMFEQRADQQSLDVDTVYVSCANHNPRIELPAISSSSTWVRTRTATVSTKSLR
jgi:Cdc6-like AAA superfamily ATPase